MKIHKAGDHIIHFSLFTFVFLNVLIYILFGSALIFFIILGVSMFLIGCIIAFFRYPSRPLNISENYIYAPADGKIVAVTKESDKEYSTTETYKISIFMSIWNVHVNWYPVSGTIIYQKHHAGKYLVAWHPKSSELNEHHTIVIRMNNGKEILVRQIAGAVARRIISKASKDQKVTQGEELGIIKFGSRVDIYLPTEAQINVSEKQVVRGNKSLIAYFD